MAGASQAARLLFSATGLAPYGSPLALELRRGGAFVAAARVGTAAVRGPCGNHFWSVGVASMAWGWTRFSLDASMADTTRIEQTQHTQVAVHGGRVHDVFEIEAFAVAAGERGRGYGQALLAALLLALAAAAPRPVVVVTLPRPQTEGFWKTTLLEWSRGSEGERGVWRALVAEDGAVEFAYPQDAATTLFWSETADRALRAVSPWFVRLAARKAEVTPDQRVADLEAALATVEAERERLAKRIRVLEARRPPAASPVPPSDEDEAGAAPAAIARHLPPVAAWPARSPRPEADDDDAAPAAAASRRPCATTLRSGLGRRRAGAATSARAPAPRFHRPDTADDEAIARLLAAERASPPVHAPPPPVRAARLRAAAKVAR